MRSVQEIDPNFRLPDEVPSDVCYFDPREAPFRLYGLTASEDGSYSRLPAELLKRCSEGIRNLSRHLAGACVRYSTDAEQLTVLWTLTDLGNMPHFAASGQSGMQLLEESNCGICHVKNLLPMMNDGKGCRREQSAFFPCRAA